MSICHLIRVFKYILGVVDDGSPSNLPCYLAIGKTSKKISENSHKKLEYWNVQYSIYLGQTIWIEWLSFNFTVEGDCWYLSHLILAIESEKMCIVKE